MYTINSISEPQGTYKKIHVMTVYGMFTLTVIQSQSESELKCPILSI